MAQGTEGRSTVPAGLPPAEAVSLEDFAGYAAGSVVSRTLLKSPAGTITYFSFDKGQALSEHSAPYDALVQIIDGAAVLTIGGKKVMARTGQVVLLPANVPHSAHAARRFKMLLTMLRS